VAKTIIQKDSILTSGEAGFIVHFGDTYIVEESVIVATGDGHAGIQMHQDSHLILKGIAAGLVGVEDIYGGQHIEITTTGTATGNPAGVFLKNDSLLDNAGHVAGNWVGVTIGGLNSDVYNSGTIQANPRDGDAAIYVNGDAGGTHTLLNSGRLINRNDDGLAIRVGSSLNSVELVSNSGKIRGGVSLSLGDDRIGNTGKMVGAIDLGEGNDVYDGRTGHHTVGLITGGSGNDKIFAGIEADSIRGGDGVDRMIGGAGPDTFYFSFVTESGTTSSTRDIIKDFVHGTDKLELSFIDSVTGGFDGAFVFDAAKGTASSAVATGHVAWYWENNAGTAKDRTIIKMNVDADSAVESTIALKGLINLTAGDFVL
jgi:Ca2+-binding RTX toxin-like protein